MGDLDVDHLSISELNKITMMIADNILKAGGTLIMKTLHGSLEKSFFVFI